MQFTTAALSDLGLVRRENEDRFLSAPDIGLFAVADGIGGLPGGAEAAECAVTALSAVAHEAVKAGQGIDLAEAVNRSNHSVVELAQRLAPNTGLGCTLCAGLIRSGTLQLANVGDSRCYLFRANQLKQLTTDDTVEHEFNVRRARGEKVEFDERYRNALTRCIGQPMDLDLKIYVHSLQVDDVLVFCSDGVSRMIDDDAILRRLREGRSAQVTLRSLINDALAAGGTDNATAIIVRIEQL